MSTRNNTRICSICGAAKPNYYAKQCRDCWLKTKSEPNRCLDCGIVTESSNRRSRPYRCRPCYKIYRQRLAQTCSKDGCERPTYAKGLCQSHYQVGWRQANPGHKAFDYAAHKLVRESPCAVCGYNRMNSEVHRIIPKGPYTIGNIVPVCSRCHDEIERGLTPCPPAWQPPRAEPAPMVTVHKTPSRYSGTCQQCGRQQIRSVAKICRQCYEVRKAAAAQVTGDLVGD